MSAPSAANDEHQEEQHHSHPKLQTVLHLTDPSSVCSPGLRTSDQTGATPSPSPVTRPSYKSPPPSAPLPPLPQDTESENTSAEEFRQLPTTTRDKSREETQTAPVPGAVVEHEPSVLHSSVSQQHKSMEEPRNLPPESQDQIVGRKVMFTSPSSPRVLPPDPSLIQPPPAPKSGLLKRLTTRLAGTRSSPALRATAAPAPLEEASKVNALETLDASRERQESRKPSPNATPFPARAVPPVPDEKGKSSVRPQQSFNGRPLFAALQERRAEKRETRVREEQLATNARRAAALAKTGLLPASRRYSVVALPNHGSEFGYLHVQPFDPFAKDQIRHGSVSDDGVVVEGDAASQDKKEHDASLTAAEIVIREWRERNTHANQTKNEAAQSEVQDDGVGQLKDEVVVMPTPSISSDPQPQPSSPTPSNSSPHMKSVSRQPKEASKDRDICSPSTSQLATSSQQLLTPDAPPWIESRQEKIDHSRVRTNERLEINEGNLKKKAQSNEKIALGSWRFPVTVPSPTSDSSGTPTPREGEHDDKIHSASPASMRSVTSTSTAIARQNDSSRPEDSPSAPPPKLVEECSPPQSTRDKEGSQSNGPLPAESLPPPQISLVASPIPSSPRPRYLQRSSTTPPTPPTCHRVQKPSHESPAPFPTLTVLLPALSPTTSTSTSTSAGSGLPRTPSTSSHGHSPVRVLNVPLESEEDALLSHEQTALQGIVESRPEVKIGGVKEFGQLARLADLDPERSDDGAFPPLPPRTPHDCSIGNVMSPIPEIDRRKRATLFGRRRAIHDDPPVITIPENSLPATKANGARSNPEISGKRPRHVSSFTNLRRTVTSVTTGFAGAALRSSRDRSPFRQTTTPSPRLPTSPHSNTSGTDSLSPTSAATSTSNQYGPGVGLRPRPLNPTMHSRGSILMETHAIEDAESRRLAELAFLD